MHLSEADRLPDERENQKASRKKKTKRHDFSFRFIRKEEYLWEDREPDLPAALFIVGVISDVTAVEMISIGRKQYCSICTSNGMKPGAGNMKR